MPGTQAALSSRAFSEPSLSLSLFVLFVMLTLYSLQFARICPYLKW